LVKLTLRHRLPTILTSRQQVLAGGLMSYFPDPLDYYRRAAF
jgi:hypothetical protein